MISLILRYDAEVDDFLRFDAPERRAGDNRPAVRHLGSNHRIDAQPFTGDQTARRFEMGCNVRKIMNVSVTMG